MKINDTFDIDNAAKEAIKLRLFSIYLHDKARRTRLNMLFARLITPWIFVLKYLAKLLTQNLVKKKQRNLVSQKIIEKIDIYWHFDV